MELDQRKRQILYAIIHDYIQTAEPVGSRAIARRHGLGVSPATIRNEMSDLEELGFLEQPHTSAGRIPSDRAYRLYVDALPKKASLTAREVELVKRMLASRMRSSEQIVQQLAKLLSALTNQTSIVLGPSEYQARLRQVQLVGLGRGQALLVGVTDGGFLINRMVEIPPDIDERSLQRLQLWLNQRLGGVPLEQIRSVDMRALQDELSSGISLFESVMDEFIGALRSREAERVYLGGATNILSQPEFKDVDKVRAILELLEEDALIWDVVMQGQGNKISVSIGSENQLTAMQNCSLITAEYHLGGGLVGRLGILGPTRMEYDRVLSLVQHICQTLNEMFG